MGTKWMPLIIIGNAEPDFTSITSGDINHEPWWMDSAMTLPSTLIAVFNGIHTTLEGLDIANNIDIKNSKFITIGKKGAQFLSKTGGDILADYSNNAPLNNVSAVLTFALGAFLDGTYKRVFVLYNSFISTLKTEATLAQILPYKLEFEQKTIEEKEYIEYLIEPSPNEIIERILRSFVEEKMRNAIIQSEAGEHSARMIAMKNATDNANDVIYNLTLLGNKLRQEKITGELLDMITAKESVETG